ncbi:DUF6443 domain-containing protein, partial [Flavobacterium sp. '19STA2R22 D10 B1']|uniref:DUF6443 domain-containing protein n=1 Tax=Flavobacterium aerium TaxID=3037261 RepID=UPI00278C67BE
MKKIVYALLLFPMIVVGQSINQNYVKTTNYREAGAANPQSQVTYFDGLGRPIQQIAQQQSGTGTDMITHIEYDSFGRPVKEYLPYAGHTNDMSFQPDALNATLNFSEYTGQSPYSETFFENSPLNRPHKKGA